MTVQQYARVEDGEIKETTLTAKMISNRAHPMRLSATHFYAPITVQKQPETAWDEEARGEYTLVGETVVLGWKVVKKGLQGQLEYIYRTFGHAVEDQEGDEPGMPGMEREVWELESVGDVDPAVAKGFMDNLGNHFTEKLEAFVRAKNFDNIVSCLSYLDEEGHPFQLRAARVKALRAGIWTTLLAKQQAIMTGAEGLPKDAQEIEGWIPEYTWED